MATPERYRKITVDVEQLADVAGAIAVYATPEELDELGAGAGDFSVIVGWSLLFVERVLRARGSTGVAGKPPDGPDDNGESSRAQDNHQGRIGGEQLP